MIARVSLEIALRREFDYAIPGELAGQVDVGSRVQVPFGARKILGVVTAVAEESAHTRLKPILKVIGAQTLVTEKVLRLARWIGEYYCCAPEIALKAVLPEAVRREDSSWRERLFVRLRTGGGELPQLSKRRRDVLSLVEERRELRLSELVELAGTTAATVRKLEDLGLVEISAQITERDPYAREHILPSQPLVLNPAQSAALEKIKAALERAAPQRAAGILPADLTSPSSSQTRDQNKSMICRQDAGSTLPGENLAAAISPFFNPAVEVRKYSGWLPHWRQSDKMYFVTFLLHDSLAQDRLRAWAAAKAIWESHHPPPWDEKSWEEYHQRFSGEMERWLDLGHGSCALRRPEIGRLVEEALRHFDGDRYQLGDFVIMPNHVHVLVRPADGEGLGEILHSWKSFTAKEANALLKRSGDFWWNEYFDHMVRSAAQYEKFQAYIQDNPGKARLPHGTYLVGKGSFNLAAALAGVVPQRAAGILPADPSGSFKPQTRDQNKSVICRQDAGSTLGAEATSASALNMGAEVKDQSMICRQDAGSTLGAEPASASVSVALNREAEPGRQSMIRRQDAGGTLPSSTFLLHGVTGSGKTEIYLQALAHTLELGKGAIVLVPEISLTPQTVERFKARFSTGKLQTLVAVLHSHLSTGERHDEWHKIRQGRARIVIGARSAIFAPVEPLGLIIVDEEHEHSYKQEEAPRYHARDVAIMRGQMEQAVVVLGSATPSLESYYNTKLGKFTLLELPERVDDQKMPRVRVVDMRQSSRPDKGPPIFSPQLKEAITQRLERGEQTILFLNRRGYASSLQCPLCGYVANCPNCSITLTYHRREQKLACHICGHVEQVPLVCPEPKCQNPAIRFAGTGTQRVEEVLAKLFPKARVSRMDADTMKRKEDYRTVLGDFRVGKIDILVGTQMIAKGLHFPNVTLVGILYADLALYQPDFRAGERTFQLLTQVAGRAGRGDVEGEVFVQAFAPFHPAIQYARRHDFNGFYDQEMEFRAQLKYPPFSRVALLTLKGRNEEKVRFVAEHLKEELEKHLRGKPGPPRTANLSPTLFDDVQTGRPPAVPAAPPKPAFKDLMLLGPSPAPLSRAETFYRYQIMLRTRAMSACSRELAVVMQNLTLPEDVTVAVDIDPVNLS